jgi:peptidoglycan/LPS O-acetylase OafA/YrhL
LQTWSFGIEEQFYLIMPISLILIFKWTKYRRASLLNAFVLWLALGIASLSIFLRSDIFSSKYYALSALGWELAAGVLLSVFIALRGEAGIFSPPLPYTL